MKKLLFILIIILSVCVLYAQKCDFSSLYGKKCAVFGGSFSCISQSEAAKNVWKEKLGLQVVTYGVGAMGFSSLTGDQNIQAQVDKAVAKDKYDIFILWASTNDFARNYPIGTYRDYTIFDNFDKTKLDTQCGGINYCIRKIYESNPLAKIYFFTTLQTVRWGERSDDPFYNGEKSKIYDYVNAQKDCCKYWGVPCFDMFECTPINDYTKKVYVQEDGLHLTEVCYKNMGESMMMFMISH